MKRKIARQCIGEYTLENKDINSQFEETDPKAAEDVTEEINGEEVAESGAETE